MVAMTVTPLMVRVALRLRMGRSCFSSCDVKTLIKSAFDGTASRWYLAAVLIFRRLTSSCVGVCIERSAVIISRRATSCVKI